MSPTDETTAARDEPALEDELVLEYELDAPPEKVWRALTTADLRARWLPDADLAEAVPVEAVPGRQVRYRMRDGEAPFAESIVTFEMRPNGVGGTRFRIVHRPSDTAGQRLMAAANSNGRCLMRAA